VIDADAFDTWRLALDNFDIPFESTRAVEAFRMSEMSRRRFVATLAASASALVTPEWLFAGSSASRTLDFSHLHTGERLAVEYFSGGSYVSDALRAVNHLLRDFRNGEEHVIDARLLDLLHALRRVTGSTRAFEVISGYRSPATNHMLRARSEGVAAGSLHMRGQAIDIRVADVALPTLRDAALDLRLGGVGFYPASNFIHVDTGRVRRW
jgi:uncharacterized protein YcbK (DUF882 family)